MLLQPLESVFGRGPLQMLKISRPESEGKLCTVTCDGNASEGWSRKAMFKV